MATATPTEGSPSSIMDTVGTVENLERAWRQSTRWAKDNYPFFSVVQAAEFEERLIQEILVIRAEVASGRFEFSPYFSLSVSKPSGGVRHFSFPEYRDAIVSQAIINSGKDRLESAVSSYSYAYRFSPEDPISTCLYEHWRKGYSRFSATLDEFLTLPPGCVIIKTDISDYYRSINQDLLLLKLGNLFQDDLTLLTLLRSLVRYRELQSDGSIADGYGLPIGPAYSHVLANLYLADLDAKWSSAAIGYARYVDDVVLVFPHATDPEGVLEEFDRDLQSLSLHRNLQKTRLGSVDEPEAILDEVRQQKYRIGAIAQDCEVEELMGHTKEFLRDVFSDFSELEDVSEIAPHLRFTLRLFQDSRLADSTINLAYEALRVGIPDPGTSRLAMLAILGEHESEMEDRYRRLIAEGHPLLQLQYLRLTLEENSAGAPTELLMNLAVSSHLLVRILALDALRARANELGQASLSNLLAINNAQHGNTPSLERAWGLAAHALAVRAEDRDAYLPLLSVLASRNDSIARTALITYLLLTKDRRLFNLFHAGLSAGASVANLVRIVNCAILVGDTKSAVELILGTEILGESERQDVFRLGLHKGYLDAVERGDLGLLVELSNSVESLAISGLEKAALAETIERLREVVQHGGRSALYQAAFWIFERLLRRVTGGPIALDGAVPTIDVEGTIYRYGQRLLFSIDQSVQLHEVETPQGDVAILETTTLTTLQRTGFSTLESWKGYLSCYGPGCLPA